MHHGRPDILLELYFLSFETTHTHMHTNISDLFEIK